MKIMIDNGHGENTPGKRSPDGRLREYAYCREIADRVVSELRKKGIDAERIVPEETDISLKERCRRANEIYEASGRQAILVSLHCNAAGNGAMWMQAKGWSVFVANNSSYNSRRLAVCLAKAADARNITVRRPYPGQDYWCQNLAICRDTLCPAVLVENFFQDNKEDIAFLLSEKGKQCVTDICVKGITNYIGERESVMKTNKVVLFFLACVIFLSLLGCKSRIQYIPVESVRTEYKNRLQRDSIYVQDSIFVREKGDTVFVDRWRYMYRDKLVTDTLLVNDTVRVPYPVEKQLSRWQQTKMDVGGWAIGVLSGVLVLGIGYVVRWVVRKRK